MTSIASGYRALLVEDEPLIAMDAENILIACGFSPVIVAMSLSAAKDAIGDSPPFDFALLDINLGQGEASYDLAWDLINAGVKVAFASGYNPSEQLVAQYNVPLITKPYTEEEIFKVVADLIETKLSSV